ncbi:unnamed protein product, partial [Clavelina lepadiformis]
MSGLFGSRGFTNKTRPSAFLRSILQNGVGRPVKQLKRITLKFCETSQHSLYARKFVEEHLIDFASRHPSVVIYALPETEAFPQVCAEYLNGREEICELNKRDCDDILKILETFADRSGVEIVRIRKDFHTDIPSLQGEWHPFLNFRSYNIVNKLDWTPKLTNAWDPVGKPWEKCYRKHELHKLENRPVLTYEEKAEKPLG